MSRSGGGYACYQRTIVRHPVPTFLIQMGSSETVIEEVRKMAEDAAAAAEAAAANPAAQNQNTTNNPAPAPEPEEAEVYQDAMQPLWLSTKYDIFTDFYTLPLNDESREEWERHLVIQLQPYHHNPHHISQAPRVHLRPYNIYLGWENILALNGRRLDDIITTFCHFASAPLTPAEADTAKYGNLRTIYIGPGRPRESLEPHLVPGVITNNHRNRLGGGIGQDAAAWWRSWGGLRRVRSEERAQAERVIARLIAYNEVVEGMDGERVKFVPVAAPMGKDKGRIEERK